MAVSIKDFEKLELKVGEILMVESVPNADKLYRLQVDIGGRQIQLVAGLKKHYDPAKLKGRRIVVLSNLEPINIKGIRSEGMLLAAVEGDRVRLVTVDEGADVGSVVA